MYINKKENNMDIFDLSIDDFKKEIKKLVDEYTPEELLNELIECGLEVNNNE